MKEMQQANNQLSDDELSDITGGSQQRGEPLPQEVCQSITSQSSCVAHQFCIWGDGCKHFREKYTSTSGWYNFKRDSAEEQLLKYE